jgi:recombinational DNA repair protein (RecF pathway)
MQQTNTQTYGWVIHELHMEGLVHVLTQACYQTGRTYKHMHCQLHSEVRVCALCYECGFEEQERVHAML